MAWRRRLRSTSRSTTRRVPTPSLLSVSSPVALLPQGVVWVTLVPSSLAAKVLPFLLCYIRQLLKRFTTTGAASDKVAALEKAGVFVTDSPAKIGTTMLKVRTLSHSANSILTLSPGHARRRSCLERRGGKLSLALLFAYIIDLGYGHCNLGTAIRTLLSVYHTTMSAIYNPSPSFQEAAAYLSSASALGSVSNAIKLEVLFPPFRTQAEFLTSPVRTSAACAQDSCTRSSST